MKHISKRVLLLVSLDFAAIFILLNLIHWNTGENLQSFLRSPSFYAPFIVFPLSFFIFDLYYPFKHFSKLKTLVDLFFSISIGMVIFTTFLFFERRSLPSPVVLLSSAAALTVLILMIRIFYDFLFRSKILNRRVLILGTGSLAQDISKLIQKTPHSGIEIAGFVAISPGPAHIAGTPVLGNAADILPLIDKHLISYVILALEPKEERSQWTTLSALFKRGILVVSALYLFEKLEGVLPFEFLDSQTLLELSSRAKLYPYMRVKRVFDIVSALLLLTVLSPVFIFIILVLGFRGINQIFFIQSRIGKNKTPFWLIKFKSMTDEKSGRQKVTWFGALMRRFRIDEIPQLINVLKGDMSLIGPRPEIPYFVERSLKRIPYYELVFALKPGLTGWAQVKFRHTTTVRGYRQKFRYNLYYLKNISPALDFIILLQTIRVVLLGAGK